MRSMTPAASKLLMCLCAGSTGAAIAPAVHHLRPYLKPHRAAAQHVAAAPIAESPVVAPCADVISGGTAAAGNNDAVAPIGLPDSGFGAAAGSAFAAGALGRGGAFGGGASQLSGASGGGGLPSGNPLPVSPIASSPISGVAPGESIAYLSPVTIRSPMPEPATWVLAIGGLGTVGAAMRRSRLRRRAWQPS